MRGALPRACVRACESSGGCQCVVVAWGGGGGVETSACDGDGDAEGAREGYTLELNFCPPGALRNRLGLTRKGGSWRTFRRLGCGSPDGLAWSGNFRVIGCRRLPEEG